VSPLVFPVLAHSQSDQAENAAYADAPRRRCSNVTGNLP
jgi:hypothetical protein